MFEVGQSVVCVNAENFEGRRQMGDWLIKGEVYTVRGECFAKDEVHFLLVGMFNPAFGDGVDIGYRASRFRPVAKRSDTLSIESFLRIKDGQFEGPKRVVEPVKKGVGV